MDRITALEVRVAALELAQATSDAALIRMTRMPSAGELADQLMRAAGYLPPGCDAAPAMAVVKPKSPQLPGGASAVALLQKVRLVLVSNNNCTVTDRPDLPPAPDTTWVTDFGAEILAVELLIEMASGSSCTDPECAAGSMCQPSERSTGPATPAAEHERSRTQPRGRL